MIKKILLNAYSYLPAKIMLKINKVRAANHRINGQFYLRVQKGGFCTIDSDFCSNSGIFAIDNRDCSKILVYSTGKLSIGKNVGISSTCIACQKAITINDNVKVGAGCLITDTDHHSMDYKLRRTGNDLEFAKTREIVINQDVFIGACSIILKGVEIGERSIIAAGSVVTSSIPADELWGGNPARFIKKLK